MNQPRMLQALRTQARSRAARRVGLAVALLLGGVVEAQAQNDTVQTKAGKTLAGKIGAETYDGLEILVKNAKQNVTWDQVTTIKYGGAPEFTDVIDKMGKVTLEESLAALEALRADAKLRPVLRQQVLFQIGSLNQRLGRMDAAVAAYTELLKNFPSSRYLDQVARGIVECHLAAKNVVQAAKSLDQLLADAKAAGVGPRFQTTAGLLRAATLEAQEKFADARTAYEAVEKTENLSPDHRASTSLGIARCLLQEGKPADAETRFRALITQDLPRQVLSGAWNGIGDIVLEQGKKKRDADTLLEALYAYMRGVVLYFPIEGDPTSEYEHALGGAYQACVFVSQVDKASEALYKQRANELKDRLKREFPNSK